MVNESDVIEALDASPLGEVLERADLTRLAAIGTLRDAPAGETLRSEGEAGGTLIVLLSGVVEVVKADRRGERQLIELGPGALLGEIGFLCGKPATATLRTRQESRIFELPREEFAALAEREEPTAMRLSLALARVLATRLSRMNDKAFELCDEVARELERSGAPEASARVRDLAAFRAQLSDLEF